MGENDRILVFPKNMCRICVDFSENVENIEDTSVSYEDNLISLLELLNLFSDIELNEEYPGTICSNCLTKAAEAYQFKIQCDKSTQIIRQLHQTVQEPKLHEESEEIKNVSEITIDEVFDINQKPKEEDHNQSKEKNETFCCSVCNKSFGNEEALRKHIQTHSLYAKHHKCRRCEKYFYTTLELRTHLNTECKNKTHICDLCNKQYKKASLLRYHKMTHSNERPYVCDMCGKKFFTNFILRMHLRNKHKVLEETKPRKPRPDRCNMKDENRPYVCPICGQSTSYKYKFLEHSEYHNQEKQYCCINCAEDFPDCLQLFQHTLVHLDPKPFKCKQCGNNFSCKQTLVKHDKIVHQRAKPYLCSTCGKSFSTLTALQAHIQTHNKGERAFHCDECGKDFAQVPYLRRHIKLVHRGIAAKCEHCGKVFRSKSSVEYHAFLHSGRKPHACTICDKAFIQRTQLNIHMRIHADNRKPIPEEEKFFKCDQCGKAFARKRFLTKHAITHTDLKPYVCDLCDKAYRQKDTLKKHIQVVHTIQDETSVDDADLSEDYSVQRKKKHSRREASKTS